MTKVLTLRLDAELLAAAEARAARLGLDRLRKMIWPAAPAAFLYTLFAKGLIFDGWPGLFYVLQRTYAELLLSLELLERKLHGRGHEAGGMRHEAGGMRQGA